MKKILLYSYFTAFFALVIFLSACDKFEEDTRPSLAATLYLKNDAYSTKVNQAIQLQVLANDSVTSQATVTFGTPRHGTLQPTGTPGNVFYQPEHNFTGTDSVNYQVCIGPNCISALVTISVLPDSSTCTVSVQNDTITVYNNQPAFINILQNDVACNNQPVIIQPASYGNATINGNRQLVYNPDSSYTGTDEVRYSLGSLSAKVTIRVRKPQVACTLAANPDMVNLPHISPVDSVAINVAANDTWCPNAPTISIHLVSQSSYGSVQVIGSGTGSRIVYMTATPLRNVTDNFQYRICQGTNCSTSTVTVNIQ